MVRHLGIREGCNQGHKDNRRRQSCKVKEGTHSNLPVNLNFRQTSVQQLSKETIIWKHLKHQNLLPLYGVSTGIKITGIEPVLCRHGRRTETFVISSKKIPPSTGSIWQVIHVYRMTLR